MSAPLRRVECCHHFEVDVEKEPKWFEWRAPHLVKVVGAATSAEVTLCGYAWQQSMASPMHTVWKPGELPGFTFGGVLIQGGVLSFRLACAAPTRVRLSFHCVGVVGDCKALS